MEIILNQYFNFKITTIKIIVLDRQGLQVTIFLEDYYYKTIVEKIRIGKKIILTINLTNLTTTL